MGNSVFPVFADRGICYHKAMSNQINSFPPIVAPDADLLILGSMPGIESLSRGEYYAHPRNSFWRIMLTLFSAAEPASYGEKKNLLLENRIALWDVAESCLREGSLDQNIRSVVPNDFPWLFAQAPRLRIIFFNGAKADELFRRLVAIPAGVETVRLPSTSPAHAIPFETKLAAWRAVREASEGR